MTYSIVARDPLTRQFAVGAQSHFFAVGRLVAWIEPGAGAVATQSFVDIDYGPLGLRGLAQGRHPQEVLDDLSAADGQRGFRQVGMVDAQGRSAAFTGAACIPAFLSISAENVAAQGNMLVSEDVVRAMLDAYRAEPGDLVDRVLAGLRAAEEAGGDARGSQSASLLVGSGTRSDTPWREIPIDIRVDDHPDPVGELERLVRVHRAFDQIGSILFAPGLMIGPYEGVPEADLDAALASLADADAVLGDNQEAAFWRAVLLERAGRADDAAQAFAAVFSRAGHLERYLEQVRIAGFLPSVRSEP